MRGRVLSLLSVLLLASIIAPTAHAHESRPILVEITETHLGLYQLRWKMPPSVRAQDIPTVVLRALCVAQRPPTARMSDGGFMGQGLYECPEGIANVEMAISYPSVNPSLSTMVRLTYLSGERQTKLLGPDERVWQIPEAETRVGVARDYTRLGIDHIWSGIDHLLFLVCLLWIAGTLRRILITVTGFTLAHSVTLAASALDLIRLPIPPVEAMIALSIVFLAREIAVDRRDSLTWAYPITVSSSFGLLHGFGFAAALAETGLPQTELPAGLLFFNVGVEVGQVLFMGAVLLGVIAARQIVTRLAATSLPERLLSQVPIRKVAGYSVGTLSSLWLIERTAAFLPGVF